MKKAPAPYRSEMMSKLRGYKREVEQINREVVSMQRDVQRSPLWSEVSLIVSRGQFLDLRWTPKYMQHHSLL